MPPPLTSTQHGFVYRLCVLNDAADTGTEVLKVKGSSMEARFHSDGSGNDWGYKVSCDM